MSLQQLFNTAVAGVIAQGQPSFVSHDKCTDDERSCRYRLDFTAECSVKCAIGHLIPDENYDPIMDRELNTDNVIAGIGLSAYIPELRALQECHDQAADDVDFITAFKTNCRKFAERRNLTTEVLDA